MFKDKRTQTTLTLPVDGGKLTIYNSLLMNHAKELEKIKGEDLESGLKRLLLYIVEYVDEEGTKHKPELKDLGELDQDDLNFIIDEIKKKMKPGESDPKPSQS